MTVISDTTIKNALLKVFLRHCGECINTNLPKVVTTSEDNLIKEEVLYAFEGELLEPTNEVYSSGINSKKEALEASALARTVLRRTWRVPRVTKSEPDNCLFRWTPFTFLFSNIKKILRGEESEEGIVKKRSKKFLALMFCVYIIMGWLISPILVVRESLLLRKHVKIKNNLRLDVKTCKELKEASLLEACSSAYKAAKIRWGLSVAALINAVIMALGIFSLIAALAITFSCGCNPIGALGIAAIVFASQGAIFMSLSTISGFITGCIRQAVRRKANLQASLSVYHFIKFRNRRMEETED